MLFLYLSCTTSENQNQRKIQDTASFVDPFAKAPNQLQGTVDQVITFDIQESIGSSFEIYFGDGESFSWSTEENIEEIQHTYTEEGTFQAVLSAMGSDGSKDSQSIAVTIRNPKLDHPSLFSAPMVNFEEHLFVAFEEGSHIIHVAPNRDVQFWETCSNPQSLSIQYDSTLHSYLPQVGLVCDDGMFQIWSTDGQQLSERDLGKGSHPTAIIGRDGMWYISTMGTAQLISIQSDLEGNILDQTSIGEVSDPKGITMDASGNTLYVTRFRSIDDEGKIYTFSANEERNWTRNEDIILSLDERGDSDNTTGGVPNLLQQLHISKDGENFHIAMTHANILRGEFNNGFPLTHESTLRAVMSVGVLDDESNTFTEQLTNRKQLDEKGRIHQIISDAFDKHLYVLHEGTASISILDAHTYQLRGSVWDLGFAPHALTFIPYLENTELLVVYSWLSRTIIGLDVTSNPPQQIWSIDLPDIDGWENVEVYNTQELRGKQIFHDAKDIRITKSGYIACSHCHPSGDQDGLIWDFSDRGEGLRNTSSLLGRSGMEMGLLHWSGNFDEVQDFEGDLRNHFGGTGFLSDDDWQRTQNPLGEPKFGLSEDLDALAAYISSLSQTPRSPFESDPAQYNTFEQYECHTCHSPPLYTTSTIEENILYDIGSISDSSGLRLGESLLGLDSPTLLGIVFTPPYLHDGSATSIESAILGHVNLSPISNEDLETLVHFVKSL